LLSMQVRLAKEFLKSVKRLPISVRSKTEAQIILLSID